MRRRTGGGAGARAWAAAAGIAAAGLSGTAFDLVRVAACPPSPQAEGASPAPAAASDLWRASAAVDPRGWIRTDSLDAAEAIQAAAADQRRLYAISNTQIAAYDRRTGKRVAVSVGPAQHLNSGFLFEGRLYCAHSNYPATPERSVLKVVDLDTMQLDTFHDFGASEGSLTWAVHHEGAWWCNFAYYGQQNHRTILVRFDSAWNPVGRWTYPRRVIEQLGGYSLSGGIWHDGQLLVTGHDDPVIFRLRLPEEGMELESVDQLPAPFTGQGFAVDPLNGGLIGIDRNHRQLVFASPADQVPVPLQPAP